MAAKFRVGATIDNFFNPGAPYGPITVTNITDAYFEVSYTETPSDTQVTQVFPWARFVSSSIHVLSD